MGSLVISNEDREGAEIIYGAEECYSHSGVLPLRNLEECGWVQATGFVWMKQKEPYEHFFTGTNTRVRYDRVVTAYVETKKMKKMTGVRSKQVLLWHHRRRCREDILQVGGGDREVVPHLGLRRRGGGGAGGEEEARSRGGRLRTSEDALPCEPRARLNCSCNNIYALRYVSISM
ncbi:hypothetical protein MUK42_30691 [Musa troglodytarum]|uniref:Uncharacterized protein n=1 Tax=Musa troglodytarum TaxID=320322 RepID=A0A9E7FIE3_9LILI|nr:hypothetical protein MUK42_30691 [Musa troglodytarum]